MSPAPYFSAAELPDPSPEYVAWVDVMGIQSSMARSLKITANFVFKLHIAALEAPRERVRLYPVMDGFYAASETRASLEPFLRSVMEAITGVFLDENTALFRFIVRGGMAFGPVVHGAKVPTGCSGTLSRSPTYRDNILLGAPMVQAHQAEDSAPPFGLYVHESARLFAPASEAPFHNVWWSWAQTGVRGRLATKLQEHYAWCLSHSLQLGYNRERIQVHQQMAEEYFATTPIQE